VKAHRRLRGSIIILVLAVVAAPLAWLVTPSPAVAAGPSAPVAISSGPALTWGIKRSWRLYVPAPAVSGGAAIVPEGTGSEYNVSWPLASGTYDAATGTTVLRYSGTAHWTKYRGVSDMHWTAPAGYTGTDPDPYVLDVTVTDPSVPIGPDGSTISADMASRDQTTWNMREHQRIDVVTLDLSGVEPTVTESPATTWPELRTIATAALSNLGLYTAGTVMDGVVLAYDGPGGAPVTAETFAAQGVDVLGVAGQNLIVDDGLATTPEFWWVEADQQIAHYRYPKAGVGYVYQAVDLATGKNLGTPLAVATADAIAPILWDTERDRVIYRTLTESSAAPATHTIRFDRASGTYVLGTITAPASFTPNAAAYDSVRDGAYRIQQVRPEGVTVNDFDNYRFELQTWRFDASGDALTNGPTYVLPNFEAGYNGSTAYPAISAGVGTTNTTSAWNSVVLGDGSLLLAGVRKPYRATIGGTITYPAGQVPGLYRVVLDDQTLTATRTAVPGTEFENSVVSTNYTQLLTGPDDLLALVNPSKAVVQTLRIGGTGVVGKVDAPVTLPKGSGEVPTAFMAALDQSDGTVWYGTRGSQAIQGVRDGRLVSSVVYPERSSRGGLLTSGPDHSLVSLSTDGLTVGLAAYYSLTRFELVGTTASVTEQPSDAAATVGAEGGADTATFTTAGTGRPELTYQWQIKKPGADRFSNLAGQTGDEASVTATRNLDGVSQVRAILSTAAGRVSTEVVDLTVRSLPLVTTEPANVTALEGTDATFAVAGTGYPEPAVTWQRRVAGYWENVGSDDPDVVASGAELTVRKVETDQSGSRFRAKLVNAVGTVYSQPTVLTVNPQVPESGLTMAGVTLSWEGTKEIQALPYAGGSNYLSAGESAGDQASYRATDGDVSVYQVSAAGQRTLATYGTRAAHVANGGSQLVELSGGIADLHADGSAQITWDGAFSANFYGGLVPFTITDPELTVATDGTAALIGDLSGYGSSQANPDEKVKLEPAADVVIATFARVELDPAGVLTVTPNYAGVEVTVPAGQAAQNRSAAGWGAWPQSWVDYQFKTGLSSYWYSSGGQADAKKPALPITVDFTGAHEVDPTKPAAPSITGQPSSVSTPAGSEVLFAVTATGEDLAYQWSKRVGSVWVALTDETAPTLRLPSAVADDAGRYRVRISNAGGVVVSNEAVLTIAAHATSLRITAPSRLVHGQRGTVTVLVPDRAGSVTLTGVGAARTATLVGGRATFALPTTLGAGAYTVRASYGGNATFGSASATARVVVQRAGVSIKAIRTVGTISATKRGRLTLALRSTTGATVHGTVMLTLRHGRLTKQVKATVRNGVATVRLPRLAAGRWTVRAVFGPNADFARAARSTAVKVRR